ncbi:MAG: bifunctional glycosyltransferase family 2/GtrA family protein [Carnobacterium sp.]|nr:bifunctional glycosyltransferase family 2/GtrA family protein [Carnobacterium sp.]
MSQVAIVIPTLEPDNKLVELVKQIRESCLKNNTIIVINDGSNQTYDPIFEEIQLHYGVIVKNHEENKGKGRAIKTAIQLVLDNFPEMIGIVTIDSDGQHTLTDMISCMDAFLLQDSSLILGVRNFSTGVPLKSKVGNVLTRNVLSLSSGIAIEDTQTGLRVISKKFMEQLLTAEGERFEFEMTMLLEAKKADVPIIGVPISTIYHNENKSTHFRALQDSVLIYSVFFKYAFSAVSSFLIDITLFTILLNLLAGFSFETVLIASVVARGASSLFNYLLNRLVVFEKGSLKSLVKYYGLVLIQILVSSGLVLLVKTLFIEMDVTFVKIIVDGTLFFVSFFIQKKYVFK